jgi:hypothetical protein
MWVQTGEFRVESAELEMTFELSETHMQEDTAFLCELLNEAWKAQFLLKTIRELDNVK